MWLTDAEAQGLLARAGHEPITDPVAALPTLAGEVVALKDILAEKIDELRGWASTDRPGRGEVRAVSPRMSGRIGHASPVAPLRYQHATEDRDAAIANALSEMANLASVTPIGSRSSAR